MPGMTLLGFNLYRGPHLFGRLPMVRLVIDLGRFAGARSSPPMAERLAAMLPGLADHHCCTGQPGGFLHRLREGTLPGHVIEHIALELQTMAGLAVTRGKTRAVRGEPGRFNVLYAYADERAGLLAGARAIELVAALLGEGEEPSGIELLRVRRAPDPLDVAAAVAGIRTIAAASALGPTTGALLHAARRRGIPVSLPHRNLAVLGTGSRQQRLRASITGRTSLIAAELAKDKQATRQVLEAAGLPVPAGQVVRTAAEAVAVARRLGLPVVVKPLDGHQGKGVTTDLSDEALVADAFALAACESRRVIVERHLAGRDYRLLVVNGRFVAAAERRPAAVTGDGRSSIADLIAQTNRDPRRGEGHGNVLSRIVTDAALDAELARQGLTLADVPAAGLTVCLRSTANLSTGGTAIDRTDEVHPENAAIAVHAAAQIGLDVCGVDVIAADIAQPLGATGGGIVEVNAAPGLRMHLAPSEGRPRDVAAPIVASLFPSARRSRIPVVAITGTNGKSTTTRMVAHILRSNGRRVGLATTTGVELDGRVLKRGDCAGPNSARAVLANPLADAAVLEVARGGILREGLGFDLCDVGAVLNISADHLGLGGVNSLRDLAMAKAVVIRNTTRAGTAVLNADDRWTRRMAALARGRIAWFSATGTIPDGARLGVASREGTIVVVRDGAERRVMAVDEIAATLGGAARFNVDNALAALAITLSLGLAEDAAVRALASFRTGFADNPGRFNVHDRDGICVVVDYAHNPAALAASGDALVRLPANGRRIGMISMPGDRRDADFAELAAVAARIFDRIVVREPDVSRGRPHGQISALLHDGLIAAGFPRERISLAPDERQGTRACIAMARRGDIVALYPTDVAEIWAIATGREERGA